jgi:sigma-E factor negative regulatory protein RseB
VITHLVLTDGLTTISVFIEPGRAGGDTDRHVQKGSVNIYTKVVDGYRVTVVGEAPAVTVQSIATSVSLKSK